MLSELFRLDHILSVCEKILYFLFANVLFIISVFPVLLFFLFMGISQVRTYLPFFMLCMVTVPPALCAMFYCMKRMVDGRERNAAKDYWQGYKTDFVQKLRLGATQLFVMFLLWTNIDFFTKQMPLLPLAILFVILFALVLLMTPNLYLLASRYEMKNMELFKSAVILTITRPVCTLGHAAAFGVSLVFFELSAGTAVLFMISIFAFLVVFISQKVLYSLEETSEK